VSGWALSTRPPILGSVLLGVGPPADQGLFDEFPSCLDHLGSFSRRERAKAFVVPSLARRLGVMEVVPQGSIETIFLREPMNKQPHPFARLRN